MKQHDPASVNAALNMAEESAALRLEGARNFRDIGGIRNRHGRRVRHGLVFRSEHMSHLTDADVECLRRIGLRLVCDLRSTHERDRLPSRLPDGADAPHILHLGINEDVNAGHDQFIARFAQDPSPSGAVTTMMETYRGQPRAFAGKLVHWFDAIIDGEALPTVVHCHAGKDRTGFAIAMLLHALDVPMNAIVEDYLATMIHYDVAAGVRSAAPILADALGGTVAEESLVAMLSVRADYLQAAFDSTVEAYGSVDRYLEQTAGLTEVRRKRLWQKLLER